MVIPIPNRGDLSFCDNWRGIRLLDVAGKLLGRIIQERLQVIAENVLLDSQCGFRRGHSCVDMIFVARQLVEKAREHNCLLFMLFINLKKAVPRAALWQVLKKFGIPPVLLSVVRSFHEGMRASVCVRGEFSDSFEVRNGERQGCTVALVYTSVLSLMTGVISVLRPVCPFSITMGASWLEIIHPNLICCFIM